MAKRNDFLTNLRNVAKHVQLGNKTAADVAESVNLWLKDGGEALKIKIEDEVERSVSKMGFVKRGEFEALKQEVARLTSSPSKKSSPKEKRSKKSTIKKTQKTATVKKRGE